MYMYIMRACTFLGQAKGRGEMDTRMEAGGRQAACRYALSSCPSFASPPGSELAPPVPTMSQKHQHQHPHAAQRDVGQHAPSPATSPPGRRVHASRNHPAEKTPCSSTPIQSARLSQAGASSGSIHCSLRVLQVVIGEHAASPHAPCAGRCCCCLMRPRPALVHDVSAVDKRVIDVVNTAFTSAPARPAGRA